MLKTVCTLPRFTRFLERQLRHFHSPAALRLPLSADKKAKPHKEKK